MTTKTIGIKEFRANISEFAKKAQEGDFCYIVMSRNKPLFELKPFAKDTSIDSLLNDILEAKKDIQKDKLYSQEDILKEFE